MIGDHIAKAIEAIGTKYNTNDLTANCIEAIQHELYLSDAELKYVANLVIKERQRVLDEGQVLLTNRAKEFAERGRRWGAKQAEAEFLAHPHPWTRKELVKIADRVVDYWGNVFSDIGESGDEFRMDLVCEMAHAARQALVSRLVELSATAFPETKQQ